MAQPEDLLALLARATPTRALTLVEHGTVSGRLRRTTWTPQRPVCHSVQPASAGDPLAGRLWSAPLLCIESRGYAVLVVVRRTGTVAVGWELAAPTAFDPADVAVISTLLPLFVHATGQARGFAGAGVLTERETAILLLVSEGLTAQATARRCGISTRTVHKHLEHAYRKIGCHDRVSAVQFLRRAGLSTAVPLALPG